MSHRRIRRRWTGDAHQQPCSQPERILRRAGREWRRGRREAETRIGAGGLERANGMACLLCHGERPARAHDEQDALRPGLENGGDVNRSHHLSG